MSNCDQFLPDLSEGKGEQGSVKSQRKVSIQSCKSHLINSSSSSISSFSSASSSSDKSNQALKQQSDNGFKLLLFSLPPVVANSALVKQRVSAKDVLAAASITTGLTLPLMVGNHQPAAANCKLITDNSDESKENPELIQQQRPPTSSVSGPKNTAMRAEQRKQNMVSVVRPVIHSPNLESIAIESGDGRDNQSDNRPRTAPKSSIIDDFIRLEQRLNSSSEQTDLDDLLLLSKGMNFQQSEQQARQQMALLKREEYELNKGIKRQHKFVLKKIEERKRYLQIVQSVWTQRDLKHAIEKLVDIYHQGLIFTCNDNRNNKVQDNKSNCQLNSLNTSLVVDVLGVLILRPKLWNLDICQLILPIIINDLLRQENPKYECYTELALKSLKLILIHFGPVIKNTLESQKESGKLSIGVDLSREDRLNKCLNCYKFLLEARAILIQKLSNQKSKSGSMCCELLRSFDFLDSIRNPSH